MSYEDLVTRFGDAPKLFERVLLYAGSFDPPAQHHVAIVERLSALRAEMLAREPHVPVRIVVWPVGAYSSKTQVAERHHRQEMVQRAFGSIPGVACEFNDLARDVGYTSTFQMQARLSFCPSTELHARYTVPLAMPGILRDVWHVIGTDNVEHIKTWNDGHELWDTFQWLVIARDGYVPTEYPKHWMQYDAHIQSGSCTDIRRRIADGGDWQSSLTPSVAEYIRTHRLYGLSCVEKDVVYG